MIYSIADLHLSFVKSKPMEVFGAVWREHDKQIKENWVSVVKDEDLVIVPGDISWATRARDAKVDLDWIGMLPGTKLFVKGNHDYWWSTMTRAKRLMPLRSHVLLNSIFIWNNIIIMGIKGWDCPGSAGFDSMKSGYAYQKECSHLERLLRETECVESKKIVAMHYPPFNYLKQPSMFTELMSSYRVNLCVYGHLHGSALRYAFDGVLDGVEYRCVSADKLLFKPEPCLPLLPFGEKGELDEHVFTI
jgi:predicted phosphohydrolase